MERNAKELHFAILNLFLKVCYQESYYCFCSEYSGCEDFYWRKKYFPLCRTPVDLYNMEKLCDYAQFDFDKLCEITKKFVHYLEECFEVKCTRDLMDLFNGHQHSTYRRDNYTGAKTELTLEEET